MDLQRFNKIMRVRVWASGVLFAIFVGVSLHGVFTGWHHDNPTPAVVLLLLAFFSWPRRAMPKNWEPDPDSDKDRQREKAQMILQRQLNRVRLFYFLSAVVLLVVLPFLLGDVDFNFAGWV